MTDNQEPARAIVNAFDTVSYVAGSKEGVGVRELAQVLRLTRGTAHRVLLSLEHCGVLRRDDKNMRYRLGPRLIEIAAAHRQSLNLGNLALPHMQRLVEQTNETVFLGVLEGSDIVVIDRVDSPEPLRMSAELGVREPLDRTSLGKVILAQLSRSRFEQIPFHADVDVEALWSELEIARRRGWALDNEDFHDGVRCIGAAIFHEDGAVAGAISVSGPIVRVTDDRLETLGGTVKAAAAAISRELGFNPRSVSSAT